MRNDPLDDIIVRRRAAGSLLYALVTGLVAAVLLIVGLPGSAAATQTTPTVCPPQGLSLSSVEVTSPKDGATVPAGSQKVSGRVGSGYTRVELLVDGTLVDAKEMGQGGGSFELSWQASGASARSATLEVVACGAGIAQLVRSSTELTVRVTPAPTTTRPPTSTTAATQSPTSVQATTSTAATPTTAVSAAATAGTTTTVGSGTTLPARVPEAAPAASARGTTTTRPRPATPPLVLSEEEGDDSPGPPLWVGAVVGLSGTIGLVLSAVFSRRSAARAARSELPPIDPADDRSDLVSL